MQLLSSHLTYGMKYQCLVSSYFCNMIFQMEALLAGIYLFKDSNRNTSTSCEICSKLTKNKPERRL